MSDTKYQNLPVDIDADDDKNKIKVLSVVDESPSSPQQPLQRYLLRAVLSTLIPLVLTTYYILTYLRWLRYPADNGAGWVVQGYLDNAENVSYSWFIIGTFALNLGTYAIAGSIASMVTTRSWNPGNARILLSLAENTFADPSTWAKIPVAIFKNKTFRGNNNGLLWNLLVVVNILGFVAWPLVGLTMQTEDGYALDVKNESRGADVIGRNETSFFARDRIHMREANLGQISAGVNPVLPRGQLYVEAESSIEPNITTDNSLPEDATDSLFLTLQADGPIVGNRVFGAVLRYNCSIVTKLNEFSILSERRTDIKANRTSRGIMYPVGGRDTGSTVFVLQDTNDPSGITYPIAYPAMEVGVSIPMQNFSGGFTWDSEHGGYTRSLKYETPGIDSPVLIEVALWQPIVKTARLPDGLSYEGVKDGDIPELLDLYPEKYNLDRQPVKAIGCRCLASSDIGFANVDGRTATFSNFELAKGVLVPPGTLTNDSGSGFKRLEVEILYSLLHYSGAGLRPNDAGNINLGSSWYISLWRATGLLRKATAIIPPARQVTYRVIQSDELRSILLRMYKIYAIQLMYDGASSADDLEWYNPNIIVASKARVLVPGAVLPEIVLSMLIVWTISIVVPAIVYQFRRRWTQKLDAFNMFKIGVQRPEAINTEKLATRKGRKELEKISGLPSDHKPRIQREP